ncbi:MAG: thioredoxin [Alphaproteobacteria bacterium]|jgi:putative thioredoxin|nr:thioredoxin [Alphaproteobacteria bacterium]MBT4020412.1 thioredoxin [Alphaproteobacteria bacterium]MBT5160639.1 thioredoxin [Alphaproteobacteria bacterium]MBT6387444.1 thioredoxin [Alphaproteobacteria bacterium]
MDEISMLSPDGAPAGLIKDSSDAAFIEDVVEVSKEVPVIVDFWAPWCEPCKQLGPAIEKVVNSANGAVRLVKIDIDQNPAIAQQLRIQSIPAVYAFKDGQPVDGFMGAVPESQIKAFVEKLVGEIGPTAAEEALEAATTALAEEDFAQAASLFGEVLRTDNSNVDALAGLTQCYIGGGDLERAGQTLDLVKPEDADKPIVTGARAALSLAEKALDAGDLEPLLAKVEANENDHQARSELSEALLAAGRKEEAVEQLLDIVRRDRKWNDDGARKQLLTLFEAFGNEDEVTQDGRQKLSILLFS